MNHEYQTTNKQPEMSNVMNDDNGNPMNNEDNDEDANEPSNEKGNRMKKTIKRIKNHLKENKTTYFVGAGCLVVGALAAMALKGKRVQPTQIVNTIAPVFNNNNSSAVTFGGYMHKIVKKDGTTEVWETVKEAADAAGVSLVRMSRHLNGHTEHLNGDTYSIIGVGTN